MAICAVNRWDAILTPASKQVHQTLKMVVVFEMKYVFMPFMLI
jgi:hypothetical protein